ncbi:class I SAM-dependent methyltransferase [Dyella sp.]|uniref:class I SAM-dependent methyltransferase n=1 Tax=Dyella sp. TaxID=1869338 RepID=UPI002D76946A|nr:methyltransferase domain-containing protein [Dyella sp.]HET7333269.1 methyltransferase domain-containing protein [Dyella sp.]
MSKFAPVVRKWMKPLQHTPFHPQWLVFRSLRRTREWVHAKACGTVLDIGCADGWVKDVLSSDCSYIGLDYPAGAGGLYDAKPCVFANGASLPFVESIFDTVLLLEVLEHVSDPEDVLSEIRRVLKPGGKLLLSVPFLYPLHDAPIDYRRYTAPGLVQILQRSGLRASEPSKSNPGFEAVALLGSIACAESVLAAWQERRWRLLCAPLFILAIPFINVLGWMLALVGANRLLASGHIIEASK